MRQHIRTVVTIDLVFSLRQLVVDMQHRHVAANTTLTIDDLLSLLRQLQIQWQFSCRSSSIGIVLGQGRIGIEGHRVLRQRPPGSGTIPSDFPGELIGGRLPAEIDCLQLHLTAQTVETIAQQLITGTFLSFGQR